MRCFVLGKNPEPLIGSRTKNQHSHSISDDVVEADDLDSRYRNEFSTSSVGVTFVRMNPVTASNKLVGHHFCQVSTSDSAHQAASNQFADMKNIFQCNSFAAEYRRSHPIMYNCKYVSSWHKVIIYSYVFTTPLAAVVLYPRCWRKA